MNNSKLRSEIPAEFKWSLDEMFPDDISFDKAISDGLSLASKLSAMQGHIMDSPSALLEALDTYAEAMRTIENVFAYSRMKRDEDNSVSDSIEKCGKAMSAYTQVAAAASFLDPEILASDTSTIASFMEKESGLGLYKHLLEELFRQKDHTLTDSQEYILASLGDVLGASGDIFTVLNNVDLEFRPVNDADGISRPLTVSSYNSFMESPSRDVRKEAYSSLYDGYKAHINTIAALFNNSVRKESVTALLRNYSSCLDAKLSPNNIPLTVYDQLLLAVHEHLGAFHKYIGIRARMMGLEKLSMYDVYAPLITSADRKYTFSEAIDLIRKALAPLGQDYIDTLINGLTSEGWVDVYENRGKTSGAYSFGTYDSKPYILMNFGGRLRDVFTLIHESGHSMHSWYTRKNQPYIYGNYAIFAAEVASTVNEVLLINYLLENTTDKDMRAYLVNFYIDEFRGTLFRQTMFAEFEKYAHEASENGMTLTAENLSEKYAELNKEYYGDYMDTDDIIRYEWSRIPHFYRAYYVYQYATGFSAANDIALRLLDEYRSGNGQHKALDGYKAFLSSGSSDDPVALLRLAGADMSTPDPVEAALGIFEKLVDELEALTL